MNATEEERTHQQPHTKTTRALLIKWEGRHVFEKMVSEALNKEPFGIINDFTHYVKEPKN